MKKSEIHEKLSILYSELEKCQNAHSELAVHRQNKVLIQIGTNAESYVFNKLNYEVYKDVIAAVKTDLQHQITELEEKLGGM